MDGSLKAAPVSPGHISGVTLHVEATGNRPGETLTFLKASSRAITIGRKSKQARPESTNLHHALFLCPVVSRKHAKITFTEYGNAFIMDLHSHHGTHILRPGDTVSKMLQPEVHTPLADGDVLTFGKSVGRDRDLVLPVVARVKLLFTPARDVALPPLPQERITISPDSEPSDRDKTVAAGSSGRYGIYVSSDSDPVSSSSSSSSSSGDSDVEEIPPPSSFAPRLRTVSSQSSNLGGRLQLLRRILPAVPPSCVDECPAGLPELLKLPIPRIVSIDDSSVSPVREESYPREDDLHMNFSEFLPGHAVEQDDPWRGFFVDAATENGDSVQAQPPSPVHVEQAGNAQDDALSVAEEGCSPSPEPIVVAPKSTAHTVIENHLKLAQDDIVSLRMTRLSDEARFEEHVREVKQRLAVLDEATNAPSPSTAVVEMADMMSRFNDLQANVAQLQQRSEETAQHEEGAVAGLQELRSALEELKSLRECIERQIARLVAELREVRVQADAAMAQAATQPTPARHKRKRSEADEGAEFGVCTGDRVVLPAPKRRRTLRHVAKRLAHTATAATVGAVAAWAALAFI